VHSDGIARVLAATCFVLGACGSYKDFNTGWPLNSWSVTEPSDGYQVAYIRLLSKFVR